MKEGVKYISQTNRLESGCAFLDESNFETGKLNG